MDTQISNISKKEIAVAIVFLLIGLLLGVFVFSNCFGINSRDNSTTKEITILNKEINSCIDQLNNCENINSNYTTPILN